MIIIARKNKNIKNAKSCIEVYLNFTSGDQVVYIVKSFFDRLTNRHQTVIPQNQHLNTCLYFSALIELKMQTKALKT